MEMDCGFYLVRNDGLYKNGVKICGDIGPESVVPVETVSGEELVKRYAGAMKEVMETAWIIDDSALKTPLKMVKLEKRYNEKSVFQSRLTAEDVRKQIQEDAKRSN